MKFINLGGATGIIEHNGMRMLFDPWLDEGIFHGSWFHYPPMKTSIEQLGRFDYVYISHIHEDHCSAGTIEHLNKDAEIIILDKKPNFVAKFLDNHRFSFKKVHLIKSKTPTPLLPNLIVDMLEGNPADPMANAIDSTLILKWDDFVIVNANDCQPYPQGMDYILENYPKIDLALLPYSGGSGYPSCYLNLSEQEKNAEKHRILNMRLDAFVQNVNYLKPNYVLPFADQYAVGGSRSDLNKYISHPSCPGIVEKFIADKTFHSKLLLLNSTQAFDLRNHTITPAEPYCHYDEKEREQYLTSLKNAAYDYEHFKLSPAVALDRLVSHARNRQWQMQQAQQYFPVFNFYLDANDMERRFVIDLNSDTSREISFHVPLKEPYLRISVPATLLMLLLVGHISWNIADAALFLDYERKPNVYDPKIYEFLNYLKI